MVLHFVSQMTTLRIPIKSWGGLGMHEGQFFGMVVLDLRRGLGWIINTQILGTSGCIHPMWYTCNLFIISKTSALFYYLYVVYMFKCQIYNGIDHLVFLNHVKLCVIYWGLRNCWVRGMVISCIGQHKDSIKSVPHIVYWVITVLMFSTVIFVMNFWGFWYIWVKFSQPILNPYGSTTDT